MPMDLSDSSKEASYDPTIHRPSAFSSLSLEELRRKQNSVQARATERNEFKFTPISEEYSKKLRGADISPFEKMLIKANELVQRPQKALKTLNPEETKVLVWQLCQGMANQRGFNFRVDDTNRAILRELTLYFSNSPDCSYDLRKGIALIGDVGTGKTLLMLIFQALAQCTQIKQFSFASTQQVFDTVAFSQKQDTLEQFYMKHFCFDDLGQEPSSLQLYANEVSIMEKVITERYNRFTKGYCLTHITTNLNTEELRERYGLRVYDRMKEMFNVISVTGRSKRN